MSSSQDHQDTFLLSNLEDDASLFDNHLSILELRHSKTSITGRKPLRSSPLAGPALVSGENDSDASTDTSRARLRRTSLPMRPESGSSHIRPPSSIHERPYYPYALPARRTPSPSRPESSIHLQPTPPRTPPRTPSPLSVRSTNSSVKSPSPIRTSKVLDDIRNRPRSLVQDSLQPPQPARLRKTASAFEPHSRPRSQHDYGMPPDHLEAPAPTKVKFGLDKGDSRDESWYTVNSYELTPKFSRLGLSSSNVVMPVSAREHRKRNSVSSPLGRGRPISPNPSLSSSVSGSRRVPAQAQAYTSAHPLPESLSPKSRARKSFFPPSLSSLISAVSSSDHRLDRPTTSRPASSIYSSPLPSPSLSSPFPASSRESGLPSSTSHRPSLAGSPASGFTSLDPDERSLDASYLGHSLSRNQSVCDSEETVRENPAHASIQCQRQLTPGPISTPLLRIRKSFSALTIKRTIKRKLQPSPTPAGEAQTQGKLSKASTVFRKERYRSDIKVEVVNEEGEIGHPPLFYGGLSQSGSDSNSTVRFSLDEKGEGLSVSEDRHLNPAPAKRKPSTARRLWRTLTGGGGNRSGGSRVA